MDLVLYDTGFPEDNIISSLNIVDITKYHDIKKTLQKASKRKSKVVTQVKY